MCNNEATSEEQLEVPPIQILSMLILQDFKAPPIIWQLFGDLLLP